MALVGGVALTACSSKPSPWSESSSPWDERAQVEEEGVEPVEGGGLESMEEEVLPVDNEFVVEEPMPEPMEQEWSPTTLSRRQPWKPARMFNARAGHPGP